MRIQPGLARVDHLDVDATQRESEQAGYTVFVLRGGTIADSESFFDAVRATFPLDPPIASSQSWDALSDSLWEGLYRHASQRIVILWPRAAFMAKSAPAEFEAALGVLTQVSNLLIDRQATCEKPKEI